MGRWRHGRLKIQIFRETKCSAPIAYPRKAVVLGARSCLENSRRPRDTRLLGTSLPGNVALARLHSPPSATIQPAVRIVLLVRRRTGNHKLPQLRLGG